MLLVNVLLLILALVLFLLAAFGAVYGRIAFGWLGLAVLTVVQLLGALG